MSGYKGTIDVEISDLRCKDEGIYLITVMSNGTQLTSRRDHLTVSGTSSTMFHLHRYGIQSRHSSEKTKIDLIYIIKLYQ